jgi:hypothetical protein
MSNDDLFGERLLLPPDLWLRTLQDEYLSEFIRAGGSAVRVVSGAPEVLDAARRNVLECAQRDNYYIADLDPGKPEADGKRPDLHRIDKFFFAVTCGVDWKSWAAEQAKQYLQSRGIYLAEGRALNDLDGIARDNEREPRDLLNQYQAEFATPQLRDHGLSVEFRAAVTALGRAQLIPDAVSPTTEEVLLAWLAGRTLPGAATALKKVGIYERVQQANARYLLASFCHWLPKTGHSGLVVTLDFRPYEYRRIPPAAKVKQQNRLMREAVERGATQEELTAVMADAEYEPPVSYSDAAYMQMLTLIRRFIDEVDWLEHFLLVILTSPLFYESKAFNPNVKRSYFDYDALQTRIGLEVHDAKRANPCAALAHLGETI